MPDWKFLSVQDLSGRAANKAALQSQLGLQEDARIPILAMIGRIDQQKGVDIILDVLRQMTDLPWQFILLGSGDPILENAAAQPASGVSRARPGGHPF